MNSRRSWRAVSHNPPVFQAVLLAMVLAAGIVALQGWIVYTHAALDGLIIVNRDFQVYYFAAKAYWAGHDPYDLQYLSLSMPRPAWSPYVYPPYALYLFYPLTWLGLGWAMAVWLALKLTAIALLCVGWLRLFGDRLPPWLLLPFTLVAFSGAVIYDVHTGNIGTVEACLLVWAIVSLDRHRPGIFVALVLAAAAMKMVPLVFLLLPFFTRPMGQALRIAASGGAIMAVLLGVTYVLLPGLTMEWLFSAKQVDWMSRSFYALAVQGQGFIDPASDPALVRRIAAAVQFALAGGIVLLTWLVARRQGQPANALLYAVAILALLLCWPRLWRYAFSNAIAPILVIALLDCRNGFLGLLRAIAMCALALLPQGDSRAQTPDEIPQVFEELAATLLAWANGLFLLARSPRTNATNEKTATQRAAASS